MPSWWGKSSSKEAKKKGNKESFIDTIHRRFKSGSEDKSNSRSGGSRRRCSEVSERGTLSRVPSRSPSPSTQVSRCQSFAERPVQRSHAQPLPLPRTQRSNIGRSDSSISASLKSEQDRSQKPSFFPLPEPGCVVNRADPTDADGDVATASVSSVSSIESDDPTESRLLSPLTSDYENGNKTVMNSPSRGTMQKDPLPNLNQKNWKETFKPSSLQFNNQTLSTSPKKQLPGFHMQSLQIPPHGAFYSAPDSSMSSPSRSPMRAFGAEQFVSSGLWAIKNYPDIASAHCSSPGSGHNSGHNSVGGDLSGQLFWQQSRCSPECSPLPSPRMISPGPSSRIHSGAVTPLHPRASGGATESPTTRPDEVKQQSHRLPLPPLTITHTSPFSPTYSASTTPSVPRSPGRAENPTSPGSRWKKGKLLGRGTFGHVYLGFNSESGEMCAMKEVTLFSDDAKSRESAQQLGQEIALLSRLQHPNIVQYYGSETVDDKLYIYLEYVSGGSIYKLLQEYGQFGEAAIRSYTQQIISGLAYLHNKNTVHRDIKGANILVDPSGRVKLADFGMAKHITGQSCPLSFKGSPYWMAPEVIKNSNGCNLAVDIWSLGCTVLEMVTSKPPWSQYEGVAAMFKIGNSKELPAIPDHLSADGKDFVLKCLQRNPANRPTASQLLEHRFVKNAAPLERPIPTADPSDGPPPVSNASRSTGIGSTRNYSNPESEWTSNYQSRGLKIGTGSSDIHIQRNISCPVSPIGSPLLHSRSPQHLSGRMSPSPISSPHTMSGASTPLTGGGGGPALSFHNMGGGAVPRSQNGFYTAGSSPYHDHKPELFRGPSQAFRDIISSDNCTLGGNQLARQPGGSGEFYDAQSVLADRLSAAFERPRKA